MTIEIADRLVKLRKKYGYSQEELADKLGLSRQAVSKWERAEASPDTDNLICLAKLYGVSLDELLATDDSVETIVNEQVKNEQDAPKQEEKIKSEVKKDKVVINNEGICVQDEDGTEVIINSDGVKNLLKDGKVIKKKHDKVMAVIGAVEGALMLLAVLAYLLLGLLSNGLLWASGWIVFFLPDIICSIVRAIYKKDARKVNIPFVSTFTFFFVCMFLPALIAGMPHLWEVMWVVFLAIPIYYSIVGAFHKAFDKFQDEDKCEKGEEEDFTSDNDEDEDDD